MGEPYRVAVTEGDRDKADLVLQVVAVRLQVPGPMIAHGSRQTPEATRARRVALYLAHVALGWQMERVAHGFGVNRQTVANACRRIEDARDEPNLDALLDQLSEAIRTVCEPPGGRRPGVPVAA